MSDPLKNFVPDQFSEILPGTSRGFDLDEYVRDAQGLKTAFVHDLEDQRNIADSNVLKAKEGVKEIFSDAMQKMKDQAAKIQEESRKTGYEEGHEEGYQDGAESVKERFSSSLDALESLVTELSEARKKLYPLMEREMVEMVTTLSRKVIRQVLEKQSDGIREIVRMAVESVMDRESLVVKINPDDNKELEDYGQELIQLFHEIKNVRIESHPSVSRGNCIVESNFGTVAAGLDHLDEHIERILHLAPPAPPPPVPLDVIEESYHSNEEDEPLGHIKPDSSSEASETEEFLEPNDSNQEEDLHFTEVSQTPDPLPEPDEPLATVEPLTPDDTNDLDITFDDDELDDPDNFMETEDAGNPLDTDDSNQEEGLHFTEAPQAPDPLLEPDEPLATVEPLTPDDTNDLDITFDDDELDDPDNFMETEDTDEPLNPDEPETSN